MSHEFGTEINVSDSLHCSECKESLEVDENGCCDNLVVIEPCVCIYKDAKNKYEQEKIKILSKIYRIIDKSNIDDNEKVSIKNEIDICNLTNDWFLT